MMCSSQLSRTRQGSWRKFADFELLKSIILLPVLIQAVVLYYRLWRLEGCRTLHGSSFNEDTACSSHVLPDMQQPTGSVSGNLQGRRSNGDTDCSLLGSTATIAQLPFLRECGSIRDHAFSDQAKHVVSGSDQYSGRVGRAQGTAIHNPNGRIQAHLRPGYKDWALFTSSKTL